jgi:hypothetical protein
MKSEKERLQDLSSSSVVDQLNKNFLFEETLVEDDWLKESIVEEE